MTELAMTPASQSLATVNPDLIPKIAQFYGALHQQAHPSWFQGHLSPALLDRLLNHPRAEHHLANWFEQTYDLEPTVPYDFDDRNHRLALLPSRHLLRLLLLVGAALQSEAIARLIQRESVQQAKRDLGEPVYRFALKKAPFLLGRFPYCQETEGNGSWRTKAWSAASACLSASLEGAPHSILKRVRLKLPRTFPTWLETRGWQAVPCGRLLRKILIHEVEPAWSPFCS